jgi:isocitrate/isopropylmalate dehydrogenase
MDNTECLYTQKPNRQQNQKQQHQQKMTTTKAIKIACYKFSSALAQKLAPTKREVVVEVFLRFGSIF